MAHNYHGPYKEVQFLSPVHCIIHASDNPCISTIVHVTRLKPYVSPDTLPIHHAPELVDEWYLTEDFPADSFFGRATGGYPRVPGL